MSDKDDYDFKDVLGTMTSLAKLDKDLHVMADRDLRKHSLTQAVMFCHLTQINSDKCLMIAEKFYQYLLTNNR